MCLEWVWLFTRWYAEIVNQSARRDDTRRDAPLRYVRPTSYCEPGFTDYIVVYYMYICIDKTMQIVLERGSIDT